MVFIGDLQVSWYKRQNLSQMVFIGVLQVNWYKRKNLSQMVFIGVLQVCWYKWKNLCEMVLLEFYWAEREPFESVSKIVYIRHDRKLI